MTVFPDGTKEALHGHQYMPTVTISYDDAQHLPMISFQEVKKGMAEIAKKLDEKVLLASLNPHFKLVSQSKTEIEFLLCKKRYVLPHDEFELLPVDNITCENLAKIYFDFLYEKIDILRREDVLGVSIDIEESPGQGATYHFQVDHEFHTVEED